MKIAFCSSKDRPNPEQTVELMLRAQAVVPGPEPVIVKVTNGALGWLSTSDRHSAIPMAHQSVSGNVLVVAGVPIDTTGGDLGVVLKQCADSGTDEFIRRFKEIDGVFAALHWDQASGVLTTFVDYLGLQPLLSYHTDRHYLLASDHCGITASGLVPLEMDPVGWGGFVGMGHTVATFSQIKDVHNVEPASIVRYTPASGKLETEIHWTWPEQNLNGASRVDLEAVVSVLDREVQAYLKHNSDTTLLLSGGADSRLILGALTRNGIRPHAAIARHADELLGADSRFAIQLARRFCTSYSELHPRRDFFSSREYLEYLDMNEVTTPSLYLFIAGLASLLGEERPAVWEGVLPNVTLFPAYNVKNPAEFLKMRVAARGSAPWKAARLVFRPELVDAMEDGVWQEMQRQAALYPDDVTGVHRLRVRNRVRHRVGPNPTRVYSNRSLPFTPCVSKELWKLTPPIPVVVKFNHPMFEGMFDRFFPDLISIPICTGVKIQGLHRASFSNRAFTAAANLSESYYVKRLQQKLGLSSENWWAPSRFVRKAIAEAELSDPYLDPDSVRRLQSADPIPGSMEDQAMQLLFYWQMWKWHLTSGLKAKEPSLLA